MFANKNWEEFTYYLFMYLRDGQRGKFRSDYFQLHRNDQLRFFNMLADTSRQTFYEFIEPNEFGPVFSKLDKVRKQLIIKEMKETYVFAMIDSLRADEMVDFFGELEPTAIAYYLQTLNKQKAEQIKMLLSYEDGTAGAMMTTEYVTAYIHEKVAVVLERLFNIGKKAETIYYIFIVTNSNQLIGVVSLRDLVVTPRDHKMGFVMKEKVISVMPSTDEQEVVQIIRDYDLLLVPVVNNNNELIGIITVDDVLDVKNVETTKRNNLVHSSQIIWSRLFLVTTLFISLIVVTVIASSRFSIQATTLTIFFPLLIAIIASVLSTQITVFSLQVLSGKRPKKEFIRLVVKNELLRALVFAIICGVLSSMIVFSFIKNNIQIGITFGVAMFLAIISCVITGALIPYVMTKLKLLSEDITILINTLVTSMICFFITVFLFYFV